MRDIEYLLNKYKGKVPGEQWDNKSDREAKRTQRLMAYLSFAEYVCVELNMNNGELAHLKQIIRIVSLKSLHSRKSYECIIVALAISIKMQNTSCKPENYKLCSDYGVDWQVIGIVLNNYSSFLENKIPLPYNKC